jgi:signal peptidase II
MKKDYIISIAIIIGLVVLDQVTKYLIVQNLVIGEEITFIKNFITITSHRNDGAAWGILGGNMIFFYIISVFAGGLFVYLMTQADFTKNKWYFFAITLMIAGGIGNFIDRVLFQEVVDFIDVDLWSYTTFPTFNVADMALVVGMILFVIDVLLEEVFKWNKKPTQ